MFDLINPTYNIYLTNLFSFSLTFILTFLLFKYDIFPQKYSYDTNIGKQKIHAGKIKRIGGLSLVTSILIVYFVFNYLFLKKFNSNYLSMLLISILKGILQ